MNWIKNIDKTDWYIILLFWLFSTPILFPQYSSLDTPFFQKIINYSSFLILDTILVIFIVHYLFRVLLPKQNYLKVAFLLIIGLGVVTLVMEYIFDVVNNRIYVRFYTLQLFYKDCIENLVDIGILTTILIGNNFYRMQLHLIKLEKDHQAHELKSLKSKINPNFLFESLDNLNVLIKENPQKATFYVDKLSKLYRYLVRHQNTEVVFLKDEMEFVTNYVFLLEERLKDRITIIIDVDLSKLESSLIPPATVHILINTLLDVNGRNQKMDVFVRDQYLFVKHEVDARNVSNFDFDQLIQSIRELTDKELVVKDCSSFIEVGIPIIDRVEG